MKHLTLAPFAIALVATLAACGQSSDTETVNSTIGDPMQDQLANAAPVELPPPLKLSKNFRCKDNSLVHIDLFEGDKLAALRDGDAPAIQLKAPEAGKPLEAEGGYKIEGSGTTLTVTQPGKPAQSCKA